MNTSSKWNHFDIITSKCRPDRHHCVGHRRVHTHTWSVTEDENDDDLHLCFSIDEEASLLNETGYRKDVCSLKLSDRRAILGALLDYHLTIKVKGDGSI